MMRWPIVLFTVFGAVSASAQSIPRDTPVALMVLREVSARTATPGLRFPLETIDPVIVDNAVVIPAGTQAWGEVVDAEPPGTGGRGGRISARLLYIEAGDRQVRVDGNASTETRRSSRDVTALSASIGPFALLARGHDARIKAGARVTGFVVAAPVGAMTRVLPSDTPVVLQTLTALSSETASRGDRVALAVAEPVRIGETVMIPAGARAFGEIVTADRKSGFGVGGRLAVALLYVEVGDRIIRLTGKRATEGRNGPARGLSGSAFVGAVAVAITGRRAEIPAGTRIEGRTLRDADVPLP
jgi:hypothetical protein